MNRSLFLRTGVAVVAGACALSAFAIGPKVIYSNVQASTTSDVPGLSGVKFAGAAGLPNGIQPFGRPAVSPDGSRFAIRADTNATTAIDEVFMVGDLTTSAVAVREGDAAPNGFIFTGTFRADYGILNDGRYAFSADTSAATTADEIACRWNGTLLELVAQEGQPVPSLSGVNYGSTMSDVRLLSSGEVFLRTTGIAGFTGRELLLRATDPSTGVIVADDSVFIPTGQFQGGTPVIMGGFSQNRNRMSFDGSSSMWHGSLASPVPSNQNEIMVRNGAVLLQEGFAIPGYSNANPVFRFYTDVNSTWQSNDGTEYILRAEINDGGTTVDRTDVVVKNGVVVAANGDNVTGTSSIKWSDDSGFTVCFFFNAINDNGDYVIGGLTDDADPNANAYLVYNGNTIIMKEGDPIDLDGNGSYDDDAFISLFNNDDGILTNGLMLYHTALLKNAAGQSIGQALLATDLNPLIVPGNTVTGTVDFGQLGGTPYNSGTNLPTSIPVSFRDASNTEIATGSATYNPVTGAFSATVPGSVTVPYRVSFKHGFWLRKTMPNPADPAAPLGSYAFGSVAPAVGDADDDNAVTPSDYGIWQVANGTFPSENTSADFDGDGAVTPSDYGLWQINNGAFGDD